MLFNCGVGEDSWDSFGLQGDQTSLSEGKSVLSVHWKDWCWSWISSTLATWWEELTHLKTPWCWERLKAGGEGDDRGWDGWMASPTQWTWVWASSRSRRWTGKPGVPGIHGVAKTLTQPSDLTELTDIPTALINGLSNSRSLCICLITLGPNFIQNRTTTMSWSLWKLFK